MRNSKAVKEIRKFNRFYTNLIGVVDRHILYSPYSLTEARILFEVFHDPNCTARNIKDILQVDEGYLSRVIHKLIKRGLIRRKQSRGDGRAFILSLSREGEKEFLKLNAEAEKSVEAMIDDLSADQISEIVTLMRRIQELLTGKGEVHESQT